MSLALTAPALAQVNGAAPPAPPAAAAASATPQQTAVDGLYVTPSNAQTPGRQAQDRYECHTWATGQTGFDPSEPGGGVPASQNASRRSDYRRAMAACLTARGYAVRYVTPPAPSAPSAAPVAPVAPAFVPRYGPPPGFPEEPSTPPPTLSYHPIEGQIDGGFDVPAGNTSHDLSGGGDAGLGLTWFPAAALPVGVRVDADYGWFGARRGLLDTASGGPYSYGNQAIYGADADLQLNLEHGSHARWYVFGGAGEYRVHTYLRQISFVPPAGCSSGFCGPGYLAPTATDEGTTGYHLSWNAGLGWEVAIGPGATFFVEARYRQIVLDDTRLQLVPVTVGLRF